MRKRTLAHIEKLEARLPAAPRPSAVVYSKEDESAEDAIERHLARWRQANPGEEVPDNIGFLVTQEPCSTIDEWARLWGPDSDNQKKRIAMYGKDKR